MSPFTPLADKLPSPSCDPDAPPPNKAAPSPKYPSEELSPSQKLLVLTDTLALTPASYPKPIWPHFVNWKQIFPLPSIPPLV